VLELIFIFIGISIRHIYRLVISDHNTTQWTITEAVVAIDGQVNSTDFSGVAYMDTSMIWAPKDYSYHCSKLGPVINFSKNESTVNVSIVFYKFQVKNDLMPLPQSGLRH